MNALDKAIEVAGSLTELARRIHANTNQVSNWRSRGVPVDKCLAVESAVDGAVTRKDLRPDDWQLYWPEMSDAKPRTKPKSSRAT